MSVVDRFDCGMPGCRIVLDGRFDSVDETAARVDSNTADPATVYRMHMIAEIVQRQGVPRSEIEHRSTAYLEGRYESMLRPEKPRERMDSASHTPASWCPPTAYSPAAGATRSSARTDAREDDLPPWKRPLAHANGALTAGERTDQREDDTPPWRRDLLHHR